MNTNHRKNNFNNMLLKFPVLYIFLIMTSSVPDFINHTRILNIAKLSEFQSSILHRNVRQYAYKYMDSIHYF